MAAGIPKSFIASILVSLLVLNTVRAISTIHMANFAASPSNANTAPTTIDCKQACAVRCSASSRPNLCNRACGSCCAACDCVPPGTSGNYEACPCYAKITTHNNKPKCP